MFTSLHRHVEFVGDEVAEARRIEHAGHADDLVVRQAREFAQRPHHRVERVGDADDERVGGVGLDAFADGLHDLQVDAEQIVAAHARLAGDPGGDDDDVGARDVGIVVRAGDLGVKARDRANLRQVERLALRHAFDDVEQDDVAEFLLRGEQRQRPADIPGSDQCDLLASHGARHSLPGKPGNASQTGGTRAKVPCRSQDWGRPYADSLNETTAKRSKIRLFLQIVRNNKRLAMQPISHGFGWTMTALA